MALSKQQLKDMACAAIDNNRDKIIEIGDAVFLTPELGYKEFKTAARVAKLFSDLGLSYREGVAVTGVNALLKGADSKLRVAVMGELDAVTAPSHRAADPVTGAAHSCGHNAMIAALAGVAYALGTTDIMRHLAGDVALMAVPAEECVEFEYRKGMIDEGKIQFIGGKQEYIHLGEMDDIDIMIMHHNGPEREGGVLGVAGHTSNGFTAKLYQYIGKASHAGGTPHLGINALNAANIGITAMNFQRETFQDKDKVRVHPIITKGGDLVNVVPDDVRIETMIRGLNMDAILDAEMKVDRAMEAGAYAVGAKLNITTLPGYLPIDMCRPLMDVMFANQQQVLGADKVLYESEPMAGSTDAGDVSYLMPTLHCRFAGVEGLMHGNDFEISDYDIAYIAPAKCLAMTVIDLLYNEAATGREIVDTFKPLMTKRQYLQEWGKLQ
ncbi:MAG: amidohydrolase [Defluviitaleaceae bacterium]|nr:amidohydrolase [Defluviitaleaceae bacterium]